MMNFRKFLFFFFVPTVLIAQTQNPQLACSSNGTDVLYVSNNNLFASQVSTNSTDLLSLLTKNDNAFNIDKSGRLRVFSIENINYGFSNNLRNTFIEIAKEKGVKNPEQMLELIQSADGKIENVSPLYNSLKKFVKGYEVYNDYQYVKAHDSFFTALTRLYLVEQDQEQELLITKIKGNIQNRLSENRKLILIPHGHGGLLTTEALRRLNEDQIYGKPLDGDDKSRVQKYLGEVRVASYSSNYVLAPEKTEIIKLSYDLPAMLIGDDSNYVPVEPSLIAYTRSLNSFADYYLNTGKLNNVPLIIKAQVERLGFLVPVRVDEILRDSVSRVATNLDDNCSIPKLKVTSPDAVLDSNGVFQISGNAGAGRTISLFARDIAISEDDDVAREAGYDHSLTTVSWKAFASYPPYPGKEISGTIDNGAVDDVLTFSMDVPYRDVSYEVFLTAKNMFGKAIQKKLLFNFKANKSPEISLSSYQCLKDQYGYRTGVQDNVLKITDDQYLFDGTKIYHASPVDQPLEYSFSDGTNTSTVTVPNSCLKEFPTYLYNFSFQCQKIYIKNDAGDLVTENSGIQWTQVSVINNRGYVVGNADLPEASYISPIVHNVQVYGTNKYFQVTLGDRCPLGENTSGGTWTVNP